MAEITEKVYCYDHPSAYNNHDALAIAAMAGRRDNENGMWPMMAMMGGGFGMNQWMNNPFAYMMMARMFGWNDGFGGGFGGFGGWGGGQNAQNIEMQNQLQAIRTQLQDNQNSGLIMDAVKGASNEVARLAQSLNCDFNTVNTAICDVRAAIQQVAGQVGYSAERVINAAQLGDMNIITQLKDCCCQNKELIQRMGYENQLGLKDVQFNTERGFCGLGREVQFGFDRTNTGLERGFSSVAYETQKQTCDIINAINASQQRTADLLNNHWSTEQANKIQDLKFELSQERQNRYIANLVNGGCGCGTGYNGAA